MTEIARDLVDSPQDLPRWKKLVVGLSKTAQRGLELLPGYVREDDVEGTAMAELEVENLLHSL